ncbi:MAG: energy transducer TonB, partial [Gemmatimonadota bacterium]|nr:energy transducer TonB [Gemmatimonadota bacterium]
ASRPSHLLRPQEVAGSTFLHLIMFGVCVAATRVAVPVVTRPVEDTTMVFVPRLTPPAVDRLVARPGLGGGGGGSGSGGHVIISANPPPRGFQVIQAVSAVPTEIPPIALGDRALDPRDFTGRGVEGGTGWGVVGGTGPTDQTEIDPALRDMLYEAGMTDQRFTPAELVVQPMFEHPRLLVEAGIGGRVVLRFIIDTTGQIEPASIEVLEKTHEAYADAARSGVIGARFRPALFGVRPVRQLTRWPVNFQVGPGA